MDDFRELFEEKIRELDNKKGLSSSFLSTEKYLWIIHRLKALNSGDVAKKEAKDYRLLKHYDIEEIRTPNKVIERLFRPGTNLIFVTKAELFNVIHEMHLLAGHGARDVMFHKAKEKYANVTREVLQLYTNLCEDCQLKKKKVRKSIVVKPIISMAMNSRAQVDLIDMQSQPDGDFKWIMNYQDHLTKFVILKPLPTKETCGVAKQLVGIFCLFDSPCILQSDNGREFASRVIKDVVKLWPGCKMVHGKPRHSQSQGSVERANQDVENILACWLKDNNTTKWADGLQHVQWAKNNRFHSGINRTPYSAMFSKEKHGLNSLNLPNEILETLESEEDLSEVVTGVREEEEVSTDAASSVAPSSVVVAPPSVAPPSAAVEINEASGSSDEDEEREDPAHDDSINQTGNIFEILLRSGINPEISCPCCDKVFIGRIRCFTCDAFCHDVPICCSYLEGGERVQCFLCARKSTVLLNRKECTARLKKQADTMLERSVKRFKPAEVGDNVLVPVPDVDRGRGEFRNIKGIVTNDNGNGCYSIGTTEGTLKQAYCRNQFIPTQAQFLRVDDVQDKLVSLREVAKKVSLCGGQGYQRCNCGTGCKNKKCSCRLAGNLCTSKCHSSLSCSNK